MLSIFYCVPTVVNKLFYVDLVISKLIKMIKKVTNDIKIVIKNIILCKNSDLGVPFKPLSNSNILNSANRKLWLREVDFSNV